VNFGPLTTTFIWLMSIVL